MAERKATYPIKDHWSFLWLLVGALLSRFSTRVWMIPVLAWFGSIFLLPFMRTQPVLRGYLLTWLVVYIVGSIPWYPILGYGMSLPVFLIIMAFNTLIIGAIPYLIDRLLSSRLPGIASTLVFPLSVTAIEFLSLSVNPMGTIGSMAYTQNSFSPLM